MKRAYKPLLFAFAIAVGLYILTMKSSKEPFYLGSLTNPSNLSSTSPTLRNTAPNLPMEWIVGVSVLGGLLFLGTLAYVSYKRR